MNFFATAVIMVTQTYVYSTAIFTLPNECNWVQIWIEADYMKWFFAVSSGHGFKSNYVHQDPLP